jgi:hypothetical protein
MRVLYKPMLDFNPAYMKKIPEDVIINHILPYTYNTQSQKLLRDIRSFSEDYSRIEAFYMTQWNELVLLNDLLIFWQMKLYPSYGIENIFENILRRSFLISSKSDADLITMVRLDFHRNLSINTERKIRFIWGLLKPYERARFIHKFLAL